MEHRREEKNILNRTNDDDKRVNGLVLIILTIFPHICVSLRKENLFVGLKGHQDLQEDPSCLRHQPLSIPVTMEWNIIVGLFASHRPKFCPCNSPSESQTWQ